MKKNAIAAIRVSTVFQGTQGDSPEAQKEQIERYALAHDIIIKKFFVFLESASKDQQPVQEAIDYCKTKKNGIQLFIIKSIDRFTRGGSYSYDHLKMQLDKSNIRLIDLYGVISQQQVNTLEHLGISFNWSVYSPTKKVEILEAERAKDEIRDIMSRMIGAEIRYERMGYWVRNAPFGYMLEKIETTNGKRSILKPHPTESEFIIKMFELRCRGTLDDHQIVDEINKLGFKTRVEIVRNPKDRTQILKRKGGNLLNIKGFWSYVQNPIYAGVHYTKWTKDNPVKANYQGLVSIEQFNEANRGKNVIIEQDGVIKVYKKKPPEYLLKKGVRNPDFPYKRIIMCPTCRRPLFGSASKGRSKYYPIYHCNKRGHYFRVTKEVLEEKVNKFVKSVYVSENYVETLVKTVTKEWNNRRQEFHNDEVSIDKKITSLNATALDIVSKIKVLSSETAIKYLEQDLIKIDEQVATLTEEKTKASTDATINVPEVMAYIVYYLRNLDKLIVDNPDPVNKAQYFGVLFDDAPTYEEIDSGSASLAYHVKLNEVFKSASSNLAAKPGFEPE